MKKIKLLLIIILILTYMTGCLSSGKSRGSLSDAMDKSRDDYEGDRSVPDNDNDKDEDEDPWGWDDDDRYDRDKNDDRYDRDDRDQEENTNTSSDTPSTVEDFIFIVRGGQGYITKPYFDSRLDGEILLGMSHNSIETYLFAGFKSEEVKPNDTLGESIEDTVLILNVGLEMRYYPLAEQKFMSPYVLGRVGGFYMLYGYENTLYAGSDEINSDSLGGLQIGAGLGVDLLHTDSFRVGAMIIPEAYLFGIETYEGFTNDLFDPFAAINIGFEVGYQF